MSEIIQCLSFSDWLISFSIIISRFIQTVPKVKISFFLWPSSIPMLCMYRSCFIPSSTDGHLGCFQIFVIVNNATMNIRLHIFFQISVLAFFEYIPGSGITGSKGSLIFNFFNISTLFSIVAAPISISTNSVRGFLLLHTLANTCCLFIY